MDRSGQRHREIEDESEVSKLDAGVVMVLTETRKAVQVTSVQKYDTFATPKFCGSKDLDFFFYS